MVPDKFWEWAREEWSTVKTVPATLIVAVLVTGLLTAWVTSCRYTDHIALVELQRDAARAGLVAPSTPAALPPTWPSVTLWSVAATSVVGLGLALRRGNRARREAREMHGRIDKLQTELRETTKERDKAHQGLATRRHQYGVEVLERYAKLRFQSGATPTVTIRHALHGKDDQLAIKTRDLIREHLKWPVHLDGSNSPALPRAKDFKVVFDVGDTLLTYGDLVHAFSEGNLLGVTVGWRKLTERQDIEHLIIEIHPSV